MNIEIKDIKFVIENIVKKHLNEKSFNVSDAAQSGLALIIRDHHSIIQFVLIDVGTTQNNFKKFFLNPKGIVKKYKKETIEQHLGDLIVPVASIELESNNECDAYEVSTVAAEKGFGPLIYDIAMNYVTSLDFGLMPSRTATSPAARKVWIYYRTKRNDVTATKLSKSCFHTNDPEIGNPELSQVESDALNHAYRASNLNFESLENNAENLTNVLDQFTINQFSQRELLDWLFYSGEKLFNQKYRVG